MPVTPRQSQSTGVPTGGSQSTGVPDALLALPSLHSQLARSLRSCTFALRNATPASCIARFLCRHAAVMQPASTIFPAARCLRCLCCLQVGTYVRDFHPRMLGLTGTPAQVARVAKAFRVYFQEVDHEEGSEDYLGEWRRCC